MRTLNIKLLRNLWSLKGQGLAIASVIAIAIAMFVTSHTVIYALHNSQQSVYQRQHFADVFVNLKRAPESVAAKLRNIPGIAILETRVLAPLNIQIPNYQDTITGIAISIPDGTQPQLNRLFLRAGQLPEAEQDEQILISDAFAEAHSLHPGDRFAVVINGRYQQLLISGIAISPEFIAQMRPGDTVPDYAHYAIVWMNRTALESAFSMDGAFNNASLSLTPGARTEAVIVALDQSLQAWGGLGAYSREHQVSNRYLTQEIDQIKVLAFILPLMFIGVAAFLLNVVTARLVRTQREQIAILKAFGYSSLSVMLHFFMLVLVVVVLGTAIGIPWGMWMAAGLAEIYQNFFRFPWMVFSLQSSVAITAILIAGGAAITGTLGAVYRAYRLPPAEAMRPEPPPHFRHSYIENLGTRWLSSPARIILRNLIRQPVKASLSILGIGFAMALIMLSGFQKGAMNYMTTTQFRWAQKQDMTLMFTEPVAASAISELYAFPGVYYAESFRTAPAILRFGQREYHTALQGYLPDSKLFNLLNKNLETIRIPEEGLLLTDYLANFLGVKPGDQLQVSVQEGRRPLLDITVAGLVTEYVGMGAYMRQSTLCRLLREGETMSGAFLAIDPHAVSKLNNYLKGVPRISGVIRRNDTINAFNEMTKKTILVFTLFSMLMAAAIAFAVVYNNARIALAERSHELASLRVLGFTQSETAFILLGELFIITLMALPLGFSIGTGLCWLLTWEMQTDLYRVPLILAPETYASACSVVLAATLVSALIVTFMLTRLNIVSALKAAE
jgi:putative ABC transport system permease protein